ncbi:F-box domain-containing protein [Mycena chlorophos]|uniref:F-box domain-containing protein n=1 Tax=Mycena chlorophos TaxID=658473 RepID=A0A8H6TH61_MYCCL|nr:F-box domain-containing protein [Mycena chlorophos]
MKLSILTLVVASVSFANAFVVVSELETSDASGPHHISLLKPIPEPIHAVPPTVIVHAGVVVPVSPEQIGNVEALSKTKASCAGGLRHKAAKMVASIKVAFGFVKAEAKGHLHTHHAQHKHDKHLQAAEADNVTEDETHHHHAHHAHHKHHHDKDGAVVQHGWKQYKGYHAHAAASSFGARIQVALMSLGPWEGRAVAFVLGCGIGVLLRMFWVLTVLTLRAFRSPRPTTVDYYYAEVDGEDELDAEEIFVAPPMYTVPIVVAVDEHGYPLEKIEPNASIEESK